MWASGGWESELPWASSPAVLPWGQWVTEIARADDEPGKLTGLS